MFLLPALLTIVFSALRHAITKNTFLASKSRCLGDRFRGPVRLSVTDKTCQSALLANHQSKILSDEAADAVLPLIRVAQAHFASQALHAVVKMGVPDILGDRVMTIDEIASQLPRRTPNMDALLRTMRLLVAVGIFVEEKKTISAEDCPGSVASFAFSLSPTGSLLRTEMPGMLQQQQNMQQPSLACLVKHWMEKSLWDAWAALPDYVSGDSSEIPFNSANGGTSISEYYGAHNPSSLRNANDFVKFISSREVAAVVEGFNWTSMSGKTLVDIGGFRGEVMGAVARKFPDVRCMSLDLPVVISSAPSPPAGVCLVAGDMFNSTTIPHCDAILLKHILCSYDDDKATEILRSCHAALPRHGKVIIGDVVLPDAGEGTFNSGNIQIFVDALLMLVGEKGERTRAQWKALAASAGFRIEEVKATSSPSCNITVLSKV